MSVMLDRAISMISDMPEEKLYYVVQLLESAQGLSENAPNGIDTPEMKALKDLQRFRRKSTVEIDYKAELTNARKSKYVGIGIDAENEYKADWGIQEMMQLGREAEENADLPI